jgi:hypothetical protein
MALRYDGNQMAVEIRSAREWVGATAGDVGAGEARSDATRVETLGLAVDLVGCALAGALDGSASQQARRASRSVSARQSESAGAASRVGAAKAEKRPAAMIARFVITLLRNHINRLTAAQASYHI